MYSLAIFYACAAVLFGACLHAANLTTRAHCTARKAALASLVLYLAITMLLASAIPWPEIMLIFAPLNLAISRAVIIRANMEIPQ